MFFNQAFLQKHLDTLSNRVDGGNDNQNKNKQEDEIEYILSYSEYLSIKYGVKNMQMIFDSAHIKEIQENMRASLVREKDLLNQHRIGVVNKDEKYDQIKTTANYCQYTDEVVISVTVETLINLGVVLFKNFFLEKKNQNFNIRYDSNGKLYTQDAFVYLRYIQDVLLDNGVKVLVLNATYDDIKKICYENYFRHFEAKKVSARDFNCLVFGMKSYPYIKITIDPRRDQKLERFLHDVIRRVKDVAFEDEHLELFDHTYQQILEEIEKKRNKYQQEARVIYYFNSLNQISEHETKIKILRKARVSHDVIYLLEEGIVARDELYVSFKFPSGLQGSSKKRLRDEMTRKKYVIVYLSALGLYYYKRDEKGLILDTQVKVQAVMKVVRDFYHQILEMRDYSFLYWDYFEQIMLAHRDMYASILSKVYKLDFLEAQKYMLEVFDCYTVSMQLVHIPESILDDSEEEVEVLNLDSGGKQVYPSCLFVEDDRLYKPGIDDNEDDSSLYI